MAERKGGFTKKQRDWIVDRDGGKSQFPIYDDDKGWGTGNPKHCGHPPDVDCSHLHVHHIKPLSEGGADSPYNACTVCQCIHTGKCPSNLINRDLWDEDERR